MFPNQQYPGPGGATGPPYSSYPQQPPHNNTGGYPQQQQQPFGNTSSYGIATGLSGGFQQNMSAPYGSNQGGYGGSGNPYAQGSNPYGGNPYGQGSNPQGGNPYGQSSHPQGGNPYGQGSHPQGGNPYGQGSYPQGGNPYGQGSYSQGGSPYGQGGYGTSGGGGGYNPSGQPPYGNMPFGPNTGSSTGGYPPQPQGGGYPPLPNDPQSSGFAGSRPPFPSGGGGYDGSAMGGSAGGFMSNDQRAQRLNQVIQQYEINPQFAARLQGLTNCEIVVLCDDSGSMNTPLQGTNQTRWDELKNLVNIVTDISAVIDSNGVDIYFLNRDPILNVTNTQNVRQIFNMQPQGLTPLVPALRRILASRRSQTFEKKLLILVATDGAPTNEYGQTDIGSLEAVLRNERTPQTYVTFLACTDDLESVNYLSNWDKSMPNLDVMDDYRSERVEIQRTRGANFPFSFGDYIVKALLGSIDPWFDSLDERA